MSTLYSYKQIVTGCAESLDVDPILFNSEIVQNPNPWDNSSSYATPQTSDKTDVSGAGTSGTSGASGYAAPTFTPLSVKGSSSITALLLAGAAASFSKSFSSSPSTAVTLPTSVQNVLDSTSKLINSGVNYVSNTVKNIVNPDGSNALNNSVATIFATPVSQTTLAGLVGIPHLGGTAECVGVVKGLTDLTGSSSQITSGLNLQNNLSVIPVGTAIGSGFGANGNYGTAAMPGGQLGYNHQTVITGFVDAKGNQLPLNADGTAQDPSQVAGFTSLNQWNGSNGTYQGTYYFKGNNSTDPGLTKDGSSYYTLRRPSESTGQLHTAGSNTINTQLSTNPTIQNNINTTSALVSPTSAAAIKTVAPYSSLAPKFDQNGATITPAGYFVNPANKGWPPSDWTLVGGKEGSTTSPAIYTSALEDVKVLSPTTEGMLDLSNPYSFAASNQALIPSIVSGQNNFYIATSQLKANTDTYDMAAAKIVENNQLVNVYQARVDVAQAKYDSLIADKYTEDGINLGPTGSVLQIYSAETELSQAKASLSDANAQLQAYTETASLARTGINDATNTINNSFSINSGQPTVTAVKEYTDTGLNGVTTTPLSSSAFGLSGPAAQTGLGSYNNPTVVFPSPTYSTAGGGNEFPLNLTSSNSPLPVARPDGSLTQQVALAGDVRYTANPAFDPTSIQRSLDEYSAAQNQDAGYGAISIGSMSSTIATDGPIQTNFAFNMPTGVPLQFSGGNGRSYIFYGDLPQPIDKASTVIEANYPVSNDTLNKITVENNFPLPQNQTTIEANYPGNQAIDSTPVGFTSLQSGSGPTQIPLGGGPVDTNNLLNDTRGSLAAPIGVDGNQLGYTNTQTMPNLTGDLGYSSPPPVSAASVGVESPDTGAYATQAEAPAPTAFSGGTFSTSGYTVPGDVPGNGGFTVTNSRTDFAPVTNEGSNAVAKPGQGGTTGSDTPGSSQQSGQQKGAC